MLPTQTVVRAMPNARVALAQYRNMSVISGPPRVRISFAEKIVHGVAIAAGCLSIPAWVLLHIRSYKER